MASKVDLSEVRWEMENRDVEWSMDKQRKKEGNESHFQGGSYMV